MPTMSAFKRPSCTIARVAGASNTASTWPPASAGTNALDPAMGTLTILMPVMAANCSAAM
ncbi:hypothetical protein D9M71_822660 [compost metagenome]